MSETIAIVPLPIAPCKHCVEDARHQDEIFGLIWCEHHRFGGVYHVEIGLWSLYGPFADETQFKRALHVMLARQISEKTH